MCGCNKILRNHLPPHAGGADHSKKTRAKPEVIYDLPAALREITRPDQHQMEGKDGGSENSEDPCQVHRCWWPELGHEIAAGERGDQAARGEGAPPDCMAAA